MKIRLVLIGSSIFATLLTLEIIIRLSLFSPYLPIPQLRHPKLYANSSTEDDYWKLRRLLGKEKDIYDKRRHPLLGWSQATTTFENPLGLRKLSLARLSSPKKKILFYGDSFVRGTGREENKICNLMTDRLAGVEAVDLGCGGYGLDQILLMFEMTHKKVHAPFIIIGILVSDDLDRSILTIRGGAKPYFLISKNTLTLQGTPLNQDPDQYVKSHPPQIKSYAFRIFWRGILSQIPDLERGFSKEEQKKAINSKILERIKKYVFNSNTLFLSFYFMRDAISIRSPGGRLF
ncbi:MAG TPA: hypothetical protein PLO78_03440 [Candidatus Omnitrophota bacterium]|nr:hypothetical protein [Candidatus Omnitrophota bacterium]